MTFFRGKGYSADFVSNMTEVKARLEAAGGAARVRLTLGADAVCSACPNNEGGRCTSAEKVARYDNAVLSRLGLKEGDEMAYKELSRLADEKILSAGQRSSVCGDCQWDSLCKT